MPPHPPAYPRAEIQARVLARVEAGWTLPALGREPGFPSRPTLFRWAKEDAAFARGLAQARNLRNGLRTQARHLALAFDEARAEAFLLRIRRGTPVVELLREPGQPNREVLNCWKRQRPGFAAAVRDAARFSRELRGPAWPFDQAVADTIIRRVFHGEAIAALWADPAMPGEKVMRRWRRERPDFHAALNMAVRVGHRRRMRAFHEPRPEVVEAGLAHIRRGGSIRSAGGMPGGPCYATIHNWRRARPDFAEALADAQWERDDRLLARGEELADTATAQTVVAGEARLAGLRQQWGRLHGRRGKGRPSRSDRPR